MKIALQFSTGIELEFFQRGILLQLTRIRVRARFAIGGGWSDNVIAILDTGSPISVLPPTLWKTLVVKLLSRQPTLFYGVGTPAAPLKGHLGEVTCMVHDDFNSSPPLHLKAHLLENDVARFSSASKIFSPMPTSSFVIARMKHTSNSKHTRFSLTQKD
jgi:hypothetical protein